MLFILMLLSSIFLVVIIFIYLFRLHKWVNKLFPLFFFIYIYRNKLNVASDLRLKISSFNPDIVILTLSWRICNVENYLRTCTLLISSRNNILANSGLLRFFYKVDGLHN